MRFRPFRKNGSHPRDEGSDFGKRGEAAFTLVEAAASIAVLTLLAFVGFAGITHASRTSANLMGNLLASSRLLDTERLLRDEVGKIQAPYWAPDAWVSIGGQTARIPYYCGNSQAAITLAVTDTSYLALSSPRGDWKLGPFKQIAFAPLKGKGEADIGLKVDIEVGGRKVSLSSVFGGVPLVVKDKR